MLRPQVFSLQEGEVQIGIIASEKQAIDATLRSLSQEDPRVCPVADRYWNARGGSYTDGGAFIYTVEQADGIARLTCTNKFGETVATPPGQLHYLPTIKVTPRTVPLAGPVKAAARSRTRRRHGGRWPAGPMTTCSAGWTRSSGTPRWGPARCGRASTR